MALSICRMTDVFPAEQAAVCWEEYEADGLQSYITHIICTELKVKFTQGKVKHTHTRTTGHYAQSILHARSQINIPKPPHVCVCACAQTRARNAQAGHADEAVAASGLRQMMDGRELMTVLGGCSLLFFSSLTPPSAVSHTLFVSLPPSLSVPSYKSTSLRWWVMEGGSVLPPLFLSATQGVGIFPSSPTALDPVQFIDTRWGSWGWGRGTRRRKETQTDMGWDG